MLIKKLKYFTWFDTTPASVVITEQDEDGEEIEVARWVGKVNFQENNQNTRTSDGDWLHISGTVRTKGDIFPAFENIASGRVYINNGSWEILRVDRVRNPDGTINHTKITLK